MSVLLAVQSYNRGGLLHNLLRSAKEFLPGSDILIVDDSSDDPLTRQVIDRSGAELLINTNTSDNKHGGLYHCMNASLQYAMDHGYDHLYIVQDDMQFVRPVTGLEAILKSTFDLDENLLQLNFNFLWKITSPGMEGKFDEAGPQGWWMKNNFGVADSGVIALDRAKRFGLEFGAGERESGLKYWNKGARLWLSSKPHLCWVPFPATFRNKKKADLVQMTRDLPNRFLVDPLTPEAIRTLQENDQPAYLEDHTRYYKRTIYPYWYQSTKPIAGIARQYANYYIRSLFA